MSKLEKGMLVLPSVKSPLPGTTARIVYAGLGEGNLTGKTLFDVFIGDMSYGFFTLNGQITTLEEAQTKLLSQISKDLNETVAQFMVRYRWLEHDQNEYYGLS